MSSDLWVSLVFATLAYAFWRTYSEPDQDRLTRTLRRYFEVINWSAVQPEIPLLVGSCVFAAVAVMFLLFAFI